VGTTVVISENMAAAGSAVATTFSSLGINGPFSTTKDGPTTDNDGGALVNGMLYFNTTDNAMMIYKTVGTEWIAATASGGVSLVMHKVTASGSETSFAAGTFTPALVYEVNNIVVFLNGVRLDATDYTATTGTSITGLAAVAASDELTVLAFKTFEVADAVSAVSGGTFSGAVTFSAGLVANTVDINGGTIDGATITGNIVGNASGTAATVTGGTQSAITTTANLVTVGALDAGSITSNFTSINVGAGAIATTGALTGGTIDATTDFTIGGLVVTDGNIADTGTLAIVPVDGCTIALGSDAGDDFNIDGGKLVVEGDSGNVGIGTSAPVTPLHVAYASSATSLASAEVNGLEINNTTETNDTYSQIQFRSGSEDGYIRAIAKGANDLDMAFVLENGSSGSYNIPLYLDGSSGNVGIGTATPLAKIHSYIPAGNAFNTAYNNYQGDGLHLHNQVGSGENNIGGAITFASASSIQRAAAIVSVQTTSDEDTMGLAFYTHPSTDWAQPIVEAMRITHAGNVGIGTATPTSLNSTDKFLEITGGSSVGIVFDDSSSVAAYEIRTDDYQFAIYNGTSQRFMISAQSNVAYTADGLWNSNARPSRHLGWYLGYRDNGAGLYSNAVGFECDTVDGLNRTGQWQDIFEIVDLAGSKRAAISSSGAYWSNGGSFGGSSDERLKTDIADASSQWDDVKAVKVRKFQWGNVPDSDKFYQIGVISQELEAAGMGGLVQEVAADKTQIAYHAPFGELDENEQSVNKVKHVKYSILQMKGFKALQEAMARIETLETKVTALEA